MADLTLTNPIYSQTEGVLFSAYGVDRGYVACTLSFEAACEQLGASHQSSEQMLLAFRLNQPRIVRALNNKTAPTDGHRLVLGASDFA
ncbi:DUF1488 family protein (plasmid) [Pararobbsia alpina]